MRDSRFTLATMFDDIREKYELKFDWNGTHSYLSTVQQIMLHFSFGYAALPPQLHCKVESKMSIP